MAANIYDGNLNIEIPTLVIKKRDYENIGAFKASGIEYTNNFNSANELSFVVHKSVVDDTVWDRINDYNIIYIPEYNEYFDMTVSITDENETIKNVTCTALCESELSQINLYEIEINTEADIARLDYDENYPTVFYRDLSGYEKGSEMYKKMYNASLLHRILDKASHYSIGEIAESLKDLKTWHEFSISNTTIYEELTGEISEQYKCLFTFNAQNRTVNAYDLCNTCNSCGFRGEFTDSCPECGSEDFRGAYGEDTTIYISKDNLAASASIASNKDSLKNCFHVTGGDDIITDSVLNINPNGSNYIYYFSPEMKREMPGELVKKIDSYMDDYNYSYNQKTFSIINSAAYNEIAQQANAMLPVEKFNLIRPEITGYKNIVKTIYESTDLHLYIQSSMFPTIVTENETLEDEISKMTTENLSPVSVSNVETAVLSSVDRAVENYCKVYINTSLYKIMVKDSSMSDMDNGNRVWTGTIELTEIADKENTGQASVSIDINSDLENFLKQKLQKELAKSDQYFKQITDIDMTEDDFKDRIKLYNIDYLQSVHNSFEDCLTIIADTASINKEVHDVFYEKYKKRIDFIDAEILSKNTWLETVKNIQEQLNDIRMDELKSLDFKTCLGEELWNVFCSYRREDDYKNENYISDNLSNSELIKKTEELLEAAKKELYKAGNMQFEVSADINNLLALPEFSEFAKNFKTGNWIHLMADDVVYPLRLLSYTINFDDLASIDVKFSTVIKTTLGQSDYTSIINSVASLSSSYPSFVQKVKNSADAFKQLEGWMQNGIDATKTKLVNDSMTQDIVIDSNGILCRAYDDIEDGYDDCQIKINRNAMYLTNDNWNSIYSAIGKYYYVDPVTKELTLAYGVLADTIVGKLIVGDKMFIGDEKGYVQITGDGINIKRGLIQSANYDEDEGTGSMIDLTNGNFSFAGQGLVYNGGNSLTVRGNIEADSIYAVDKYSLYSNNSQNTVLYGECSLSQGATWSTVLRLNDYAYIKLAETNGINMNTGRRTCRIDFHADDIYFNDNNIYSSTAQITTSDRNMKENIKPLADKHIEFFSLLQPVSFTFIDGSSGRTHIGFISQDVEDAMSEAGLTDLDFAGFCKKVKTIEIKDEDGNKRYEIEKDENGEPVYIYSLRYEEFIALNTFMIQKLYKGYEEQKKENQEIRERMERLEKKINNLK